MTKQYSKDSSTRDELEGCQLEVNMSREREEMSSFNNIICPFQEIAFGLALTKGVILDSRK